MSPHCPVCKVTSLLSGDKRAKAPCADRDLKGHIAEIQSYGRIKASSLIFTASSSLPCRISCSMIRLSATGPARVLALARITWRRSPLAGVSGVHFWARRGGHLGVPRVPSRGGSSSSSSSIFIDPSTPVWAYVASHYGGAPIPTQD